MRNDRLYSGIRPYDGHSIGTVCFIAGNIPHNRLFVCGFGVRIGARSYIIAGIGLIDAVSVGKRPRAPNINE